MKLKMMTEEKDKKGRVGRERKWEEGRMRDERPL